MIERVTHSHRATRRGLLALLVVFTAACSQQAGGDAAASGAPAPQAGAASQLQPAPGSVMDGAGASGAAPPQASGAAGDDGEPSAIAPQPMGLPGAGPSAEPPSQNEPGDPEPGVSEGAGQTDVIFGQEVSRSEAYYTDAGRIYRGDGEVRLFGLNWFGLETDALALFGPNEADRSVGDFLDQIVALGFNALRIPLSPQSIRPGSPSASWAVRDGLDSGRAHADELLLAAAERGLYMLLDVHTCLHTVGYMAGAPDDPQCGGYDRAAWLTDLEMLAEMAEAHAPQVVGIDLFNEPHSLTWEAWRAMVEAGGEAVLRANPRILVFVEGVGAEGYAGQDAPFWGENLSAAAGDPPDLPTSRMVYSPHVYGPSVYEQEYFMGPGFPANMPAIWDAHFGSLFDGNQPVVVGEFGGRYEGPDQVWQDAFVDYLLARGARSFFYWSLNPNSGDTGGLLQDDWRTVNAGKLALLERLME